MLAPFIHEPLLALQTFSNLHFLLHFTFPALYNDSLGLPSRDSNIVIHFLPSVCFWNRWINPHYKPHSFIFHAYKTRTTWHYCHVLLPGWGAAWFPYATTVVIGLFFLFKAAVWETLWVSLFQQLSCEMSFQSQKLKLSVNGIVYSGYHALMTAEKNDVSLMGTNLFMNHGNFVICVVWTDATPRGAWHGASTLTIQALWVYRCQGLG